MNVDDLRKLGMSVVREVEIPFEWQVNLNLASDEEILRVFEFHHSPEIELRPLYLPKWLYEGLVKRDLLDKIQKWYGKISIQDSKFFIK